MDTRTFTTMTIIVLLAVTCGFTVSATRADNQPFDLPIGRWDVRVKTLQPEPAELTYTETHEWVLDHHSLKVRTEPWSVGYLIPGSGQMGLVHAHHGMDQPGQRRYLLPDASGVR